MPVRKLLTRSVFVDLVIETAHENARAQVHAPDVGLRVPCHVAVELHFLLLRIQWEHDVTRFLNENWAMQRVVL